MLGVSAKPVPRTTRKAFRSSHKGVLGCHVHDSNSQAREYGFFAAVCDRSRQPLAAVAQLLPHQHFSSPSHEDGVLPAPRVLGLPGFLKETPNGPTHGWTLPQATSVQKKNGF